MIKKLPRVSNRAFDLLGDGPQVLLLHGYTGSPYDLRPLGDFLHHRGFRVLAPLLKGHGTKPENLYNATAEEWILQSMEALQEFDEKKPIIVGGLSMGALLAIVLGAMDKRIKALLLFSPAFCVGYLADLVLLSAHFGLLNKKSSIKKFSGSDILDPDARLSCPSYNEMPIEGLLQFEKLRKMAKAKLPYVSCPIFMAFGKQDAAINIYDSHQMIMKTTTQRVFSKFYDKSKHVITLDYDREELNKDVWYFLTSHL